MSDRFLYTLPTDPVAVPLVEQLTDEYHTRYGDYFEKGGASQEMNRYPPERFSAPDGAFVLLLRGERPIAGGAFMRYDEHTAELKRMWTDRDHRRQGLARRVLAELEAQALRQNYRKVYLTTGFRQPEARELYLRAGYSPLFDLDAEPETVQILAFEKRLLPVGALFANENGDAPRSAAAGK
ncbi:GNAT family N-acetyltransferase [Devosia rhizoryzae]|uniref:GNAT family N-acetyltransferase n=1 Tax=Devosia rhizoryzae TaxID=2774137 RepID=A0ABX7C5E5_9HYPH|nr:GNAT family N-acetyltransferase [Devosia rhizoryzae]QQR38489.1 GNAT family N-acetyltransferase [Devosia rhizoryzae]